MLWNRCHVSKCADKTCWRSRRLWRLQRTKLMEHESISYPIRIWPDNNEALYLESVVLEMLKQIKSEERRNWRSWQKIDNDMPVSSSRWCCQTADNSLLIHTRLQLDSIPPPTALQATELRDFSRTKSFSDILSILCHFYCCQIVAAATRFTRSRPGHWVNGRSTKDRKRDRALPTTKKARFNR